MAERAWCEEHQRWPSERAKDDKERKLANFAANRERGGRATSGDSALPEALRARAQRVDAPAAAAAAPPAARPGAAKLAALRKKADAVAAVAAEAKATERAVVRAVGGAAPKIAPIAPVPTTPGGGGAPARFA